MTINSFTQQIIVSTQDNSFEGLHKFDLIGTYTNRDGTEITNSEFKVEITMLRQEEIEQYIVNRTEEVVEQNYSEYIADYTPVF